MKKKRARRNRINQRYLAIPWLDLCLTARLPEKIGQPLRPMPTKSAWLAPLLGMTASPARQFKGDQSQAVWLPNRKFAKLWQHYVKDTAVPDNTPPPMPTNLELKGRQLT